MCCYSTINWTDTVYKADIFQSLNNVHEKHECVYLLKSMFQCVGMRCNGISNNRTKQTYRELFTRIHNAQQHRYTFITVKRSQPQHSKVIGVSVVSCTLFR